MPDQVRQVETRFTTVDETTGVLNKIHSGASRVNNIFNKVTNTLGTLGDVAAGALGGFAVGTAVAGATRYLRTVRDISAATGFAASNVDAVLEVMDRANISADEGSQIIQKMSISMQRYRMEIEKSGAAQSDASRIIQRLGVNLKAGPQEAMVRLAQLAKAGKLSMADLNIAFQVSETSAIRLQALLQRGPQVVSRIMGELQEQGLAINAQNIQAFNRYEEATIRIRSAWNRIAIVVSSRVMPVVADLLEGVRDRLEGWVTRAADWGESIAGWLKNHLDLVIKIGKVLATNAALQKITGRGLGDVAAGLGGRVGRMLGIPGAAGAAGKVGAVAEAAAVARPALKIPKKLYAKLTEVSARQINTAAIAGVYARQQGGFLTKLGGFFTGMFGKLGRMPVVGPLLTKITGVMAVAGPTLLRFGSILVRFTAVGLLITAIIAMSVWAYKAIRGNIMGVQDLILGFWAQFQARLMVVWDVVRPLVSSLRRVFSTEGVIGRFFVKTLVEVINYLGRQVDLILRLFQTITIMVHAITTNFVEALKAGPAQLFMRAWEEAERRTEQARKKMAVTGAAEEEEGRRRPRVPAVRPPPPVYDFRGSRFDITQQFAEGFDPDRIAVAFSNDLATLGERRVQSALAPLFAVR